MSKFTDNLKKLHEAARKGDRVDSGVPLREWVEAGNTLDCTLRNAVPAIIEALEATEQAKGMIVGAPFRERVYRALDALDVLVKSE